MRIENSNRKDKRFVAIFNDGTKINFGLKGGSTFLEHKDIKKRENYIKRHSVRENFNNPKTAGSLSRWILWNTSNLEKNINEFNNRFNV